MTQALANMCLTYLYSIIAGFRNNLTTAIGRVQGKLQSRLKPRPESLMTKTPQIHQNQTS